MKHLYPSLLPIYRLPVSEQSEATGTNLGILTRYLGFNLGFSAEASIERRAPQEGVNSLLGEMTTSSRRFE